MNIIHIMAFVKSSIQLFFMNLQSVLTMVKRICILRSVQEKRSSMVSNEVLSKVLSEELIENRAENALGGRFDDNLYRLGPGTRREMIVVALLTQILIELKKLNAENSSWKSERDSEYGDSVRLSGGVEAVKGG